jgi:hypothetical protein
VSIHIERDGSQASGNVLLMGLHQRVLVRDLLQRALVWFWQREDGEDKAGDRDSGGKGHSSDRWKLLSRYGKAKASRNAQTLPKAAAMPWPVVRNITGNSSAG